MSGINPLADDTEIKIYPNPADHILSVFMPEGMQSERMVLMNMLGEKLEETGSNILDISKIPDGMYLISVQTEKTSLRKKIIISH